MYKTYSHNNFLKYNIKFSQNFITDSKLSKEIVDLMDIYPEDFVIEIGPGEGSLTQHILKKTKKVIVVEKDVNLAHKLESKFRNLIVIKQDFLNYQLPVEGGYKVVGNIPFAYTSRIIRKCLGSNNAPEILSLIMQKEAAVRLTGEHYESVYSLINKPWYDFKIVKQFKRSDFSPAPSVDVVMLNIFKIEDPYISEDLESLYNDFIAFCFLKGKFGLSTALKKIFSYKQLSLISKSLKINIKSKPSELKFQKWLELFEIFYRYVPFDKKKIVEDYYSQI